MNSLLGLALLGTSFAAPLDRAIHPASALNVTRLQPANGAAGLCLDTPLRMELSGKARMNWSGSIRIRDLETNTVVKTWAITRNPGDPDVASVHADWPWKDAVGPQTRNIWPVFLDSLPGPLAEIRLPQRLLQPDTRYQVEVDGGILAGADGSPFPGIAAGAWTFTTGARPATKSRVIVAADNSGDACSIQGGIDLVPSGSRTPVQVLVLPGYYREMVSAARKDRLQLFGAGAERTFIRYRNSNNLNAGTPLRNLVSLEGDGMQIRGLSFINTIGVDGTQAEALHIQGDTNLVADVVLRSHQDTWLNTGGRVYVQDAAIEGSVDFIWGYSPAYFKRCRLAFTRSGSVIVQPRNPSGTRGYVFEGCTLRAAAAAFTGSYFARDGGPGHAFGEAVFLNTTVDGGILAASPWLIDARTDAATLNFCEYRSRHPDGSLIAIQDLQRRNRQCSAEMARQFSDPAYVLGGWNPAPQPFASVLAGFPAAVATARAAPPPRPAKTRPVFSRGAWEWRSPGTGRSRVRRILPDGSATRP